MERTNDHGDDQAKCYTLQQYAMSADGKVAENEDLLSANGELMVFLGISAEDAHDGVACTAFDNALGMAKFLLEDPEGWEGGEGCLPFLGITAHDGTDFSDEAFARNEDPSGWASGWCEMVDGEFVYHSTNIDDDAALWDRVYGGPAFSEFVASVKGVGLIDRELTEAAFSVGRKAEPVGDDGVKVRFGTASGVTVEVLAQDEADAERRIIATFGDGVTIDARRTVEMVERTILLHLNVTLDRADERDVEAIETAVMGALAVGLDPDETNLDQSQIVVAMAEEI